MFKIFIYKIVTQLSHFTSQRECLFTRTQVNKTKSTLVLVKMFYICYMKCHQEVVYMLTLNIQ